MQLIAEIDNAEFLYEINVVDNSGMGLVAR